MTLLEGVVNGDLAKRTIETDNRYVTTVMLVSGGYPGQYEKGRPITGFEKTEDCVLFHSGTKKTDNNIVTSGGRVLAVSAWGKTMKEALNGSYRNAELISFDGIYYRNDIGFDL